MDLENDQHTPHPAESAPLPPPLERNLWDCLRMERDDSGWEADAIAQLECRCKGNPLRQLWRNFSAGFRMLVFLRVGIDRLCSSAGALVGLAVADFLLNLLTSFLLVGRGGYLSYSAMPPFFFHIPLLLLFGLCAGRILLRPSLVTAIPVALISLSIPLELCHGALERISQLQQFKWLELYLDAPHYYRFFTWWGIASLVFLRRIPLVSRLRRVAVLLLFLVLVAAPLWFFPRGDLWVSASQNGESGELHLTEAVLSAQGKLLDGELAGLEHGRKGETELYFVGFAGDATQDVFLKEARTMEQTLDDRFGTFGRNVLMANNPQTASTLPFATAGNLERALARVGQVMNRDDDVLFLFLTSHGSKEHELAVNNNPLELDPLKPEMVRDMLKKSGIVWKVVVVSACYSGGFIEPLEDDHTVVITAADASHESFGCGYGENMTWFGQAFIDHGLRQTFSFTQAFEKARETIRQWEEKEGEQPSNPQIWVGREMGRKLARLEKELQAKQE